MPPSIARSGTYIVNASEMGSQRMMIRKPDGSCDMRYGYQWFWDKDPEMPCQVPPWGNLYAIDVSTGAVIWRSVLGRHRRLGRSQHGTAPMSAASSSTGGGLIFIGGTDDKRLRAFGNQDRQGVVDVQAARLALWHAAHLSWPQRQAVCRGRDDRRILGGSAGADDVTAFALP